MIKKVIVSTLCFLIVGCETVAPIRAYEGPAKSKKETSELQVYNFCPYKLDGKLLNIGCESDSLKLFLLEVEPGLHKLEVIYNAKSSTPGPLLNAILDNQFSGDVFSEDLNVKAGYSYFISPDLYGLTVECEGVSVKERSRK